MLYKILTMKILFFYILLLCSFCIHSQTGKVIKVKDGDTIVIIDTTNTQHTIRIADIDCPEKGQPFGTKAKNFTSDEIFGKIVTIESKGIDRFGRTIGFVLYNNKNLSFELLKSGLAWHYKYYSKNKEMAKIEVVAKKNKIGLWIDPNPINPYNWRRNKR